LLHTVLALDQAMLPRLCPISWQYNSTSSSILLSQSLDSTEAPSSLYGPGMFCVRQLMHLDHPLSWRESLAGLSTNIQQLRGDSKLAFGE
jgi:hypothetical protein